MALTHEERANLRDRPAEYATIHSLNIGGEDWSKRLLSCTVTWSAEAVGGSSMEMTVEGSLEKLINAPVTFSIGYGHDDVRPYFRGRLMMPKDDPQLPQSTGVAFGPFRLLTDTYLRRNIAYQGKNLEYVFMELSRLAEFPSGDFMILGGRNYNVPAGELFAMGTALQEVASSIIETAEYVAFDQPGGRRVVMPKPKPGSNGSMKAVYTPSNYKSFEVEPAHEVQYHSVVVYRNEGSTFGGSPIYAEREIGANVRFKPPRARIYYVPDFPGTQSQAADEAMRLAQNLRDGEGNFNISMAFNRNISLYDGFRAIRVKNLRGGKQQREVYICTITGEVTMSYSPGALEMTAGGVCYEIKDEKYEIDERYEKRALSHGVVVPSVEFTTPADEFVPPEDFTFIG